MKSKVKGYSRKTKRGGKKPVRGHYRRIKTPTYTSEAKGMNGMTECNPQIDESPEIGSNLYR